MTRLEKLNQRLSFYQALASQMMANHQPCAKWLKQAIRCTYNEKLALEVRNANS